MDRPGPLLRVGFPFVTSIGGFTGGVTAAYPRDMAIGEEGRLYILVVLPEVRRHGIRVGNWDDEVLGTIDICDEWYYDLSGAYCGQWLHGLIRDRDENLFVSDEALHWISMFSREGELLDRWGEHGDGDGQLDRPSGIAFDAEENMYVVDTLNHRVQKFTKDGKYLMKWGSFGDGDGQFNMPWGIALDEQGDVYVSDWRNDRIQRFTADGQFILKLGTTGSGDGQLDRPAGVAVDSDGDIYVADMRNNRVQQFDATGQYVGNFLGDAPVDEERQAGLRSRGLRASEVAALEQGKRLALPMSVRLDDQGRLCIVDHDAHRIQVYQKEAYPQIMEEPKVPSLIFNPLS